MAEKCITSISQAITNSLAKTNNETTENESSDENEDHKESSHEVYTPNSVDKCVLYLETPLVDQSDEKSSVDESDTSDKKSNRLSDEFFSADDDDVCNSENESKNTSQSDTNVPDAIRYESKSPDNKPMNCDSSQLVVFQEENSTDDNVIARSNSTTVYIEDELSSSSNLIGLSNEQDESSPHSSGSTVNINLNENCDEEAANHGDEHNTEDRVYYSDQVQLIDAIERSDFEDEQKLIGANLIKENVLVSDDNRLNIGMLKTFSQFDTNETGKNNICNSNFNETDKTRNDDNSQESLTIALNTESKNLATTPTSSRKKMDRAIVKSISKINFVDNLEDYHRNDTESYNETVTLNKANSTAHQLLKSSDASADASTYTNCNSSESLLSDKSCQTPSFLQNDTANSAEECTKIKYGKYNECHDIASTSKSFSNENCQYSNVSSNSTKLTSTITQPEQNDHIAVQEEDSGISEEISKEKSNHPTSSDVSNSERMSSATNNTDRSNSLSDGNQQTSHALDGVEPHQDYDEDTWADCEDVYDMEEICTCQDYSDEDAHASSEDELPSRDVDLSCYTHLDSISEDILHEGNSETPRNYRKRKITETVTSFSEGVGCDVTPANRKRLALDNASATKLCTPVTPITLTSPSSVNSLTLSEKRTPRSIIPTRDNPPPELSDWLLQFQRWSHVERLVAVDRLIEHCEPTQVRHMMKVIEPQFQRDFISLLPKELALQVLSYLEPRDLLRAAQTCRSWRFLCDDNLLWKEKCKKAAIVIEPSTDRPKRGRAGNMPPISSPWKAAYMRQHIIEVNWRSRPIKNPKILKGHDDHVITCLQFCGNRIVSGSDDNTLKVWSAITGKCLRTLVGHTGGVWSSQMAGNIVISGSTDRTLKVWNADTGLCNHTLYGHTSTVRCMHLHGRKVVSGSRDATLRVWDIVQGKCLHILVGHLAAVRCVQYDGKLVVSGAYDYMVKVWNPERQECLHTLQGHTNRVYSLQFDGVHVVSGSLDTSIRVWDAESGSCKHTLMGHQSLTSGMELRQNILVSGNADSTVKVWDITNGQCLQTLSGPNKHQSAVTCLQFNSRFVVTSSDDGTVKLWDVRTGEFIRNLITLDSGGSGGVVWRIRANDTKLICAVGSRNGTEETKLMALDFDVEGACLKCS